MLPARRRSIGRLRADRGLLRVGGRLPCCLLRACGARLHHDGAVGAAGPLLPSARISTRVLARRRARGAGFLLRAGRNHGALWRGRPLGQQGLRGLRRGGTAGQEGAHERGGVLGRGGAQVGHAGQRQRGREGGLGEVGAGGASCRGNHFGPARAGQLAEALDALLRGQLRAAREAPEGDARAGGGGRGGGPERAQPDVDPEQVRAGGGEGDDGFRHEDHLLGRHLPGQRHRQVQRDRHDPLLRQLHHELLRQQPRHRLAGLGEGQPDAPREPLPVRAQAGQLQHRVHHGGGQAAGAHKPQGQHRVPHRQRGRHRYGRRPRRGAQLGRPRSHLLPDPGQPRAPVAGGGAQRERAGGEEAAHAAGHRRGGRPGERRGPGARHRRGPREGRQLADAKVEGIGARRRGPQGAVGESHEPALDAARHARGQGQLLDVAGRARRPEAGREAAHGQPLREHVPGSRLLARTRQQRVRRQLRVGTHAGQLRREERVGREGDGAVPTDTHVPRRQKVTRVGEGTHRQRGGRRGAVVGARLPFAPRARAIRPTSSALLGVLPASFLAVRLVEVRAKRRTLVEVRAKRRTSAILGKHPRGLGQVVQLRAPGVGGQVGGGPRRARGGARPARDRVRRHEGHQEASHARQQAAGLQLHAHQHRGHRHGPVTHEQQQPSPQQQARGPRLRRLRDLVQRQPRDPTEQDRMFPARRLRRGCAPRRDPAQHHVLRRVRLAKGRTQLAPQLVQQLAQRIRRLPRPRRRAPKHSLRDAAHLGVRG